MNETEVKKILNPLIEYSRKHILSYIDVSEKSLNEYLNEFNDGNDSILILASLIASIIENEKSLMSNGLKSQNLYTSPEDVDLDSYNIVLHCLGAAIGITSVVAIIKNHMAITSAHSLGYTAGKLALHVLKKIGLRFLGVIGLAFAIHNFGSCIGWWSLAPIENYLSCENDLLRVSTYDNFTYLISKNSVNYVAPNDFSFPLSPTIKTYMIQTDVAIGSGTVIDDSNCKAKMNASILHSTIDPNSIEEYNSVNINTSGISIVGIFEPDTSLSVEELAEFMTND